MDTVVQLQRKGSRSNGTLTIFVGYFSGTGKSYAMLQAGQQAKAAGTDVVIGWLSPERWPDTQQLAKGFEMVEPSDYLALDACLKRRPQLILIDELFRENGDGSRHRKRYQDVEELLKSGIDVYTTLDIQHIESLQDTISGIFGDTVAQRIPDRVFDRAEQVLFVDIEPETLRQRLQQEKQTQRFSSYSLAQLSALREIALRRCAQRVAAYTRGIHSKNEYRSHEHILACLSAAPSNARIIRTAARMADAFQCGFTALFVETKAFARMAQQDRQRLESNMRLAQQLYEGIDIKGNGTVGVITYLRTDSTRISQEAESLAADYIEDQYGREYIAAAGREPKKASANVQDAHEAIRPTDVTRLPVLLKESLTRDQFRLYQLIWRRFVASQMASAVYETVSVKIAGGEYLFTVAASRVKFDGFLSVYSPGDEEKAENNALIRGIEKDSSLTFGGFDGQQHFTQPPAHYTEASLVKVMEELGIGRPSTYAPTITTLLARRYVAKENKNLYITELGEVVNNMMKEAFPSIVDVNFTANMETLLDSVEDGSVKWKTIVRNFYPDLDAAVKEAEQKLPEYKIQDEVTDVICEECGRNMVIKYGPHGRFLACPGFPECRNTKPYLEKIGVKCPVCGKEVVLRKTKKGRKYYGCENNPECEFMSWQKPSSKPCPRCGGYMVEKGSRLVCHDKQCGYVEKIQ